MTIVTRAAEHRGEGRRRRFGGQKIMNDRRIRARGIRELQCDKNHGQRAHYPYQLCFHSIIEQANARNVRAV